MRASAQVTADEESFTAVRHHAVRAMTSSQVTATSSLEALTAAADAAARAALHTLNVPRRERHSQRARNSGTPPRPSRPSPGKPRSPYSRPAPGKPQPRRTTAGKEEPPRYPGPRTVEPRATPPRHAGRNHTRPPSGNRLQDIHRTLMPQHPRQSQTPKVRGVGLGPPSRQLTGCYLHGRGFLAYPPLPTTPKASHLPLIDADVRNALILASASGVD